MFGTPRSLLRVGLVRSPHIVGAIFSGRDVIYASALWNNGCPDALVCACVTCLFASVLLHGAGLHITFMHTGKPHTLAGACSKC